MKQGRKGLCKEKREKRECRGECDQDKNHFSEQCHLTEQGGKGTREN